MQMQTLITPDLLGIIISTIGAVIVAIITKTGVETARKKQASKGKETGQLAPNTEKYLEWVVIGVAAAITFVVINLVYSAFFIPKPAVQITSPRHGGGMDVQIVNGGSGGFSVSGTSTGVSDSADLRIFVLVHPAQPFAEGWWVQPAVVMNTNGTWSGQAWVGDPASPPQPGDLVELVAIAANPVQVPGGGKVADPKDLQPVAQSNVVRFSIKTTQ